MNTRRIACRNLCVTALSLALASTARADFLTATAPVSPGRVTAVQSSSQAQHADRYTFHYQATVIEQGHARITAPYSSANSLQPDPESAVSVTSTLFLGLRLLPGTELYVNPELAGGRGMSGALGLAGAANGETYRIGDPRPVVSTARLYLRQIVGFGTEMEKLDDAPNQIADAVATHRLMLEAGKFSLTDNFDGNAYSHDPRSQFMNWALMSSAAWDYPADTRGYTWGVFTEYHAPLWAVRGAAVAEPKVANMLDMDRRIGRANGFVVEAEHEIHLGGRKGTARLLGYYNEAHMGNYDQALSQPGIPDVTLTRAYGRSKYGVASSNDLQLSDHLGAFSRLSWSDGRNETWAFTEVDASEALGLDFKPAVWGRPQDDWGVAAVFDELSGPHRRYLAAGGMGFIIGDGALHYGPEMIAETYYRCQAMEHLWVSPDAQFIVNPAYNRARGPVPVWGVRVHAEF